MEMKKEKTRILAECAIMVALATVLSMIKIYGAVLGGSVTLFSMVPIFITAFRHGPKWGFGSAFVYSVIQLLLDVSTVGYIPTVTGIILCTLLDYVLAFLGLGVVGFFNIDAPKPAKRIARVALAVFTACLLRYAIHVLSGAVVWYEITKAGNWNDYVNKVGMWTYSIVYNLQYMLPETILSMIAAPVVITVLDAVRKERK